MQKRFLSMILTLAIVLSLFAGLTLTASATVAATTTQRIYLVDTWGNWSEANALIYVYAKDGSQDFESGHSAYPGYLMSRTVGASGVPVYFADIPSNTGTVEFSRWNPDDTTVKWTEITGVNLTDTGVDTEHVYRLKTWTSCEKTDVALDDILNGYQFKVYFVANGNDHVDIWRWCGSDNGFDKNYQAKDRFTWVGNVQQGERIATTQYSVYEIADVTYSPFHYESSLDNDQFLLSFGSEATKSADYRLSDCVTLNDRVAYFTYIDGSFQQINYLSGWSVTTAGEIGVSFYFDVTKELAVDADAKLYWSYGDGEEAKNGNLALSSLNKIDKYVATVPVAAKDFGKQVSITIKKSDGTEKTLYNGVLEAFGSKSVSDYLDALVDSASHVTYHDVAKAMYDYCAYAAAYFEVDGAPAAKYNLNDASAPAAAPANIDALPSNITYKGSSLLLKDKTVMRFYFTYTGDLDTLTMNGAEVTPASKTVGGETWYYVDSEPIAAKNLGETVTLKMGDTAILTDTPINYAGRMCVSYSTNTELVNLLKALVVYNTEASAPGLFS